MISDWEVNWIRNNPQHYDSKGHSEAVILNIDKRLKIVELEKQIEDLKKELGIK